MASTFGNLFRIVSFGESHGKAVGVVIDGCPARIPIDQSFIQKELDRRKPGQSRITSQRRETDKILILSGIEEGLSTGAPIAMQVINKDARSKDYKEMQTVFRPSHADFTYQEKYGIRSVAGGGRASARETIARVAAGAIAGRLLAQENIEVLAWVDSVQDLQANIDEEALQANEIEASETRCPDPSVAAKMFDRIDAMRKEGNSVGGTIRAIVRNMPTGLGEPVFDKLEAELAKAIMSIPAAKAFEVGSGFSGTTMTGKDHNDAFYVDASGVIRTRSNHSGGIQGGISNGENIRLRVGFKPTATILMEQESVSLSGTPTILQARGRHDPCVLPRAVPIVEAMIKLVLADHLLIHKARRN